MPVAAVEKWDLHLKVGVIQPTQLPLAMSCAAFALVSPLPFPQQHRLSHSDTATVMMINKRIVIYVHTCRIESNLSMPSVSTIRCLRGIIIKVDMQNTPRTAVRPQWTCGGRVVAGGHDVVYRLQIRQLHKYHA
jgi:hypothetical protein